MSLTCKLSAKLTVFAQNCYLKVTAWVLRGGRGEVSQIHKKKIGSVGTFSMFRHPLVEFGGRGLSVLVVGRTMVSGRAGFGWLTASEVACHLTLKHCTIDLLLIWAVQTCIYCGQEIAKMREWYLPGSGTVFPDMSFE
ncbi:uncharacterized protein LACBIDRAFT_327424 [Laccaria bicolor S238N-H82]|uniref:Predicted protein n=1 Tax=Laccaria bicolor (strain S238N-H82 / ATCC MYA-4686) TaxID=486041 RepID=B0DB14_LACBS|nr:uncharacterized protein LACBIDRAFT_327424 [Laccaria bicolor S238N-H82]EDR08305.1 predicted protein [Laccaria bicolor S238N-H82]|eukprot:XP_001881375.1 predicted protein [Laccaria bicolor S238N-H82]